MDVVIPRHGQRFVESLVLIPVEHHPRFVARVPPVERPAPRLRELNQLLRITSFVKDPKSDLLVLFPLFESAQIIGLGELALACDEEDAARIP